MKPRATGIHYKSFVLFQHIVVSLIIFNECAHRSHIVCILCSTCAMSLVILVFLKYLLRIISNSHNLCNLHIFFNRLNFSH